MRRHIANPMLRSALLVLVCVLPVQAQLQPAVPPSTIILPEIPLLIEDSCTTPADCVGDVSLIREDPVSGDYDFTQGTIPAYRTSADGRIGLDVRLSNSKVTFVLLRPENLTDPVQRGTGIPRASDIVAPITPKLPQTDFHTLPSPYSTTHQTLCDPTSQFPAVGDDTNPKPCTNNFTWDCYDLTIISIVDLQNGDFQLWGTPTEVQVQNPKEASAQIVAVTPGIPVSGPTFTVDAIFEPMVTSDGRLLVARLGNTSYSWTHPVSGTTLTQDTDIVYAVSPESGPNAPCDMNGWSQFHPISHAPYDTDMIGRYGIAAYPFRDSFGQPIPDGHDPRVTYPWIDRHGNNLFFEAVGATLYYHDTSTVYERYPSACVSGYACTFPTTPADIGNNAYESHRITTRGVSFAGLWSHGKMVLLDKRFNNTDFGLLRPGENHRMLSLYAPHTHPTLVGHTGEVRVGTGRDNGNDVSAPPLSTTNTALIDSLENLFNYRDHLVPLTVRDVVWLVNTGKASAEVAFDDYLDPHGFIVADMSAALSFDSNETRLIYHDGFDQTGNNTGNGFTQTPRFQNAATATAWTVPPFGLAHGDIRVEPVALGGIEGKGLWMHGNTSDGIEFPVPAQPQNVSFSNVDWYYGIFLDPRFNDDDTPRLLFTFPDGSQVVLRGTNQIGYLDASGNILHTITLPVNQLLSGAWSHLGFITRNAGQDVDFYLNGFLFDVRIGGVSLFQMQPGPGSSFFVGAEQSGVLSGVRGWVDELRVLARHPGVEVACNMARGTLIGLNASSDQAWQDVAATYPLAAHNAVTNALPSGVVYPAYACYHDYRDPLNANLGNLPSGTDSLRSMLLFPEGPLVHSQPRPDSSANAFCNSCHVAGQPAMLGPSALTPDPYTLMEDDPRRQPMQPPRLIFGNIPANFIGSYPSAPIYPLPEGEKLDPVIYP